MNKAKKSTVNYYIGGQAVIEGVMMRGKTMYAMAVRKPDKSIEVVDKPIVPASERYTLLKWPLIRGVAAFIDSLVMGVKIITQSAELAGEALEEEEPTKFEAFLIKHLGEKKINDYIVYFSVFLAIVMSVGLFMLLPVLIGGVFVPIIEGNTWALGIIEGFVRIAIFLLYIILISRSREIRRVFAYHGAEHKTINCFEHEDALTVANVQKHSRLHKRCGTSFLLIVMLVSMAVFLFMRTDVFWIRLVSRIVFVPLIAGLSYEIIKWAGRNDSALVSIISFPGMCLQKLTTLEPDAGQIEVAIAAMSEVLKNEPGR